MDLLACVRAYACVLKTYMCMYMTAFMFVCVGVCVRELYIIYIRAYMYTCFKTWYTSSSMSTALMVIVIVDGRTDTQTDDGRHYYDYALRQNLPRGQKV
jgi:hypothetical protein